MYLLGGHMKNLLKIGQVCHLYGISLDTLRYYDRKDLLKPIVDKENGYRYYSLEHLDILEMLLVGRYLEIPLDEMKEKMSNESIEGYLSMMEEHGQRIQERRNQLEILSQYTAEMTRLLKRIRTFENDYTFSNMTVEEKVDITIFNVPINSLFSRRDSRIEGIESIEFDQWVTYYVSKGGGLVTDNQTMGLSIPSQMIHNNELRDHLETMLKTEKVSKHHLSGGYRHIDFWGKEEDLIEYLQLICHTYKLCDTTLSVKFSFALLHKDMAHDYFAEIFF